MPYLYTQMWRASRENEPVVRPLFYDFPDDRSALDVQDSFMLGPDILVAPVLEEGASDRQVYLPEHAGGWFDFHDGRHFEGGQTITVPAPLGRLPVFVRCGAMIPVTRQTDRIDPRADTQRELIVFGAPQEVPTRTFMRMTAIHRTGRATAGWSFAFSCSETVRISCCRSTSIGSYRPAFETISVRPVGIEGQIRIEAPEGAIKIEQGAPAFQE